MRGSAVIRPAAQISDKRTSTIPSAAMFQTRERIGLSLSVIFLVYTHASTPGCSSSPRRHLGP